MRAAGQTIFALLVFVAALPAREQPREVLEAFEKQLRTANETAGPAVACVVVSRSDRYLKVANPDQPGKLGGYDLKAFLTEHPTEARLARTLDLSRVDNIPDHGYACGVVIDPAGLILTPYHVLDGATKVYVHLPGRAGSYADIHAADARYDLAVLKLLTPPERLTAIKFADVRLAPADPAQPSPLKGKWVVTMANGYGTGGAVDKPTGALGTIAQVRATGLVEPKDPRDPNAPLPSVSYYYFGSFLELGTITETKTGAAASGSAVLNLDGDLVGLTTSLAAIGGGDGAPQYAFPADENFQRIVGVLRRGEEVNPGYLGIRLKDSAVSLQIESVTPHGPASRAGILDGDTITQINGVPVRTYPELLFHIGAALADSNVRLVVSHQGESRETVVTLGKFRHTQPVIASVRPEPVFGLRVDYGCLLAQPPVPACTSVPPGVWAREIAPNSPAAGAFKKVADGPHQWTVTHVNGTAVNTPAEFYKAAKGQTSVRLTVVDPVEANRKEREVTLP